MLTHTGAIGELVKLTFIGLEHTLNHPRTGPPAEHLVIDNHIQLRYDGLIVTPKELIELVRGVPDAVDVGSGDNTDGRVNKVPDCKGHLCIRNLIQHRDIDIELLRPLLLRSLRLQCMFCVV